MASTNDNQILATDLSEQARSANKPAILFVGHGSRDVEAVEEFYQLAD